MSIISDKVVCKSDLYPEDIIIHQEREDLFYAIITEGTHDHQQIKLLSGPTHLGPFSYVKIIYDGSARIGSLVKYGDEYRLYFNEINLVDRDIRFTSYFSAPHVYQLGYSGLHRTNVSCIDNYYCQPFCIYQDNVFVLFVNKVSKNKRRNQVDVYHSKDGVQFFQKFPNPLINPDKYESYNTKIGNPCALYDDGKFIIIAECNKNDCGWYLCKFIWDENGDPIYGHKAIIGEDAIRANPFLYKHEGKYVLYFGVFNGKNYEVYAREYESINEII